MFLGAWTTISEGILKIYENLRYLAKTKTKK
jgi:hypothetical protein